MILNNRQQGSTLCYIPGHEYAIRTNLRMPDWLLPLLAERANMTALRALAATMWDLGVQPSPGASDGLGAGPAVSALDTSCGLRGNGYDCCGGVSAVVQSYPLSALSSPRTRRYPHTKNRTVPPAITPTATAVAIDHQGLT